MARAKIVDRDSYAQRFQLADYHRGMMSLAMDASLELMGAANTDRGPLPASTLEQLLGSVEALHVSGREPGDGMMLAILLARIPSPLATNALVEVVTDPKANPMVRESALVSLGSHLSPREIAERIGLNFSDAPNSDAERMVCRGFVVSVHNSLNRDQSGMEYAESAFRKMLAWKASPAQDDLRVAVLNSSWVAKMPGLTPLATSLSLDETHPEVAAAARQLLARLAKTDR